MNNYNINPPVAGVSADNQAIRTVQADAINPSPQNNLSEREKALSEYCAYVDNLVNFGIFDAQKGQAVKQNLMNEMTNYTTNAQNPLMPDMPQAQIQSGFAEFLAEQPQFFDNRDNLKQYLQIVGVQLDKDEFAKIAQLIQELESAAVERFSQKSEHGETLKEYNRQAKERLKTLSSSVTGGKLETQKLFTPEEIGKMTPTQFKKNEQTINMQLQKRLF